MTCRPVAHERLQSVRVVGGELTYRIDGISGPWIIAAHSLGASHRMWDAQVAALVGSHRLLRFDQRGHGASSGTTCDGSMEQAVEDVVALMNHLEIESAHLLGLSLGGAIAIAFSIRHPARVRSVIACCCRVDAPAAYADVWRKRLEQVEREGMGAVAEPTLARWFTPGSHDGIELRERIDAARTQLLATSVSGYRYGIQTLLSVNDTNALATIRSPTLLIAGSADTAVPPSVMAELHGRIVNSQFVVLSDTAHLCNVERAALFDSHLLTWLTRRS